MDFFSCFIRLSLNLFCYYLNCKNNFCYFISSYPNTTAQKRNSETEGQTCITSPKLSVIPPHASLVGCITANQFTLKSRLKKLPYPTVLHSSNSLALCHTKTFSSMTYCHKKVKNPRVVAYTVKQVYCLTGM